MGYEFRRGTVQYCTADLDVRRLDKTDLPPQNWRLPMAHLLVSDDCALCKRQLNPGAKHYIHLPQICSWYHSDLADQVAKNHDLTLAQNIIKTSVGGCVFAVAMGRLAYAGKIGRMTGSVLGGLLSDLCFVTGIIDIVLTAKESAPPLPACKKGGCGEHELTLPGCILMCGSCGVDCKGSWRNADSDKNCCQVCEICWSMTVCMKCKEADATRRLHIKSSVKKVHRKLGTQLYGTNKGDRIAGSTMALAGAFIPILGWGLIAGGITHNIIASATAKPYTTIKCESCQREEKTEEKEKLGSFLDNGCEEWCMTCGVRSTDTSTCCLVLCDDCEL